MKITILENENALRFESVELREIEGEDFQKAKNRAGTKSAIKFYLALISLICTFDNKKYTIEELYNLKSEDFKALIKQIDEKALNYIAILSIDKAKEVLSIFSIYDKSLKQVN